MPGVDPKILDPRDTYADAAQWEEKAKDLAGRFVKNFGKYTTNEAGKALVAAGPCLEVAAPEAAACDAKADKGCCICNWFKKLFCK